MALTEAPRLAWPSPLLGLMNVPLRKDLWPVSLSTFDAAAGSTAKTARLAQRDVAAAEVIVGQARSRVAVALGATLVQLAFIFWLAGSSNPATLLGVTFAYAAFAGASAIAIGRWQRASPAVVTLVMAGDLAFIFAMTAGGTTPEHYERALFGAMIVIHLANFYFGRHQALRTVTLSVIGYAALVATSSRQMLLIDRVEELWSLAIGAAGTVLVIVQSGHVRRRLQTIVSLFERAEEGDFSHSYDETADVRPDAITRVGRAYNRVRSQLASMVLTDPLTGCLNRRGFDQALAREVARSARAGSELALLALDLDHFKDINDTYGHLTGDEVLRVAGTLLNRVKRAGDVVARTGGEEFAILLPDTDAAGAFQLANRLCDVLRRHSFPPASPGGPPIRITTSVGVASDAPLLDSDGAARLSERADMALYAAKRSGRDRVRAWSGHLRGEGDDQDWKLSAERA